MFFVIIVLISRLKQILGEWSRREKIFPLNISFWLLFSLCVVVSRERWIFIVFPPWLLLEKHIREKRVKNTTITIVWVVKWVRRMRVAIYERWHLIHNIIWHMFIFIAIPIRWWKQRELGERQNIHSTKREGLGEARWKLLLNVYSGKATQKNIIFNLKKAKESQEKYFSHSTTSQRIHVALFLCVVYDRKY